MGQSEKSKRNYFLSFGFYFSFVRRLTSICMKSKMRSMQQFWFNFFSMGIIQLVFASKTLLFRFFLCESLHIHWRLRYILKCPHKLQNSMCWHIAWRSECERKRERCNVKSEEHWSICGMKAILLIYIIINGWYFIILVFSVFVVGGHVSYAIRVHIQQMLRTPSYTYLLSFRVCVCVCSPVYRC